MNLLSGADICAQSSQFAHHLQPIAAGLEHSILSEQDQRLCHVVIIRMSRGKDLRTVRVPASFKWPPL